MTWERIAKRRPWPFFDRVESGANLVEKLSRGVASGPWRRVVGIRFPTCELMALADECENTKYRELGNA